MKDTLDHEKTFKKEEVDNARILGDLYMGEAATWKKEEVKKGEWPEGRLYMSYGM